MGKPSKPPDRNWATARAIPAGVAGSRLDPQIVERPFAQQAAIGDAIERDPARHRQVVAAGDLFGVACEAQHDVFADALHRGGRARTAIDRDLQPLGFPIATIDGQRKLGLRRLEEPALRELEAVPLELGRGLAAYPAGDLRRIQGLQSTHIEATLGYKSLDEAIHRDDLVIL
mgnify:CR=1 FL=1